MYFGAKNSLSYLLDLAEYICGKIDGFWRKSGFIPILFAYMREMLYFCGRFCKVNIAKQLYKIQLFHLTNKTQKHMKKLFTLAAAVLASFSLWAATETHPSSAPSSNADIVGTSYTISGTFNAGAGSAKVGAMPDKGIKFRLNRAAVGDLSNAIEFKVNEGYVINAIQLVGITNSNGKAATVGSIYVDGVAWNGTFNGTLPAKDASEASDIQISGIAAAQSVVFVFSDLGGATQGNICYTVTYEEAVQKEVDHVDVTLGGVAINGEALSDIQMATLYGAQSLELANEYAEAPTVTFTVQTDTYYVGEETPSTKSEGIDVVAELVAGKWQAQYTVGEHTYTITAVKPATATVTYMDGETVLGTEIVKVGESATKHGEYEVKPLAEFQGWYTDAELTSEADLSATVGADMVLYGKFVKAYAQSLNIEQLVLDEGTKADIASILTNHGFAYAHINALDTLNDLENKANRNYAFLGLKLKTAGAYIQFNLQAGKTLAVKFGNLTKPVAVTINGEAQADHTEGAFLLDAANADRFIELKTTDGATVVLQQIMIGEAIADVTLPDPSAYLITIAESANGTVTANWDNKKYRTPVGATVTLTFTPAEGYIVMHCYVNETEIHQSAPGAPITFEMPAEDVTITTEFSLPTGIENAEEAVKAVKVVENGQMFILKGGVKYNAQGAIVK